MADIIRMVEAADVALSAEAARLRDDPAITTAGALSEIADQPPAFALAAAGLAAGWLMGRPRMAEAGLRALLSLALATRAKGAIKAAVVRTRPFAMIDGDDYSFEPGHSDRHEDHSFPSGHTADAFAAARALGRVYPRARLPLLGMAALIGAVQVPRATHHTADVLAGAALGALAEATIHAALSSVPRGRVRATRRAVARRRLPRGTAPPG